MKRIDDSANVPFINDLLVQLQNSASDEYRLKALQDLGLMPDAVSRYNDIADIINNKGASKRAKKGAFKMYTELMDEAIPYEKAIAANPLKKINIDGTEVNALKYNMGALGSAIQSNPLKAAGLGVLGATNIAGLLDNEQIGGQLVGGIGGGALAHFLPVSPMAKVAIGLGGGTLGSLFDKLRAKKAEEQAMAQQYAQY